MSGFSRSIKPPSYLTPYCRPSMSRSFSNSTLNSEDGDLCLSGRTSPSPSYTTSSRHPGTGSRYQSSNAASAAGAPPSSAPSATDTTSASFTSTTKPISIEIPRTIKSASSSFRTPPEPLSARGDLPGGYFPLHEDPQDRLHRPHPFLHKGEIHQHSSSSKPDATFLERRPLPHSKTTGAMGNVNVPVASYFPTGYQDNALPMGKYYPSNYESTHKHSRPSSSSVTPPTNPNSPAVDAQTSRAEAEVRRKTQLLQYQRDMMAQVSRAASEIVGDSQSKGANSPRLVARMGFSGLDARFATPHKPHAPRLHPLGSPGPVTPMELESSGSSYLDKGETDVKPSASSLAPREKGFFPYST